MGKRNLYHERQESKLCALHCVNTVLQAPLFCEFDLADMAFDLDQAERQVMLGSDAVSGDFLPEVSHNVSRNGDFSIQVLTKALEVWGLEIIPLNNPMAQLAQETPEDETAFVCHLRNHWFCIRKVDEEWYNFDSMLNAPNHLSKFYLSAYLDSLKGSGWSIFLVRGDFPKECPGKGSNGYGRWMSPEEAERTNDTASKKRDRSDRQQRRHRRFGSPIRVESDGDDYDDDDDGALKDAIAASLRDSAAADDEKKTDSSGNGEKENVSLENENQPDCSENEKENTSQANENQPDSSRNEKTGEERDAKKRRVEG